MGHYRKYGRRETLARLGLLRRKLSGGQGRQISAFWADSVQFTGSTTQIACLAFN